MKPAFSEIGNYALYLVGIFIAAVDVRLGWELGGKIWSIL